MPGSANPWATELKAKKSKNPESDPVSSTQPSNKGKAESSSISKSSRTTPNETETGSGNNKMKKVPKKTSNVSLSENASGVKLKQAPLKAKNPKQIKEPQTNPREEPDLGVKVKKKPILEENVDAKSLYEEARNHLKKTKEFKPGSQSKLTPSSNKDNDEDDEDNNNPVERLIRQNSRLKDKTAVGEQSIKVQVMPELLCSKLASVLPCPLSSC